MSAKQKIAIGVLIFVSAAAAIRAGMGLYGLYGPSTPSRFKLGPEDKAREDKRFQPSARALELLNRTYAPVPKFDGTFPCVFGVCNGI
jgi:hypothetical protein